MKGRKISLSFIVFVNLAICGCLAAGRNDVWNINESGFFDASNKAYAIRDGCVIVDLKQPVPLCPTGLGQLASGRESVREIRLLFESAVSGDHWLHVSWSPGGSGREQFDVLHNSAAVGKSALIDADAKPNLFIAEKFKVGLSKGENRIALRHTSGDGLRFKYLFLSASDKKPSVPLLNPMLKFPTVKAYELECRRPGIMLDSTYVRLFAPKHRAREARIVFEYLVKAYDELYRLVGIHTEYKIIVYHFPEGNKHSRGGTSNCTIWYSYKNLDLNSQKEWTQYGAPHVSGYIEEMAHNFDGNAGAQFGWEMIGWNLGMKVTGKIADNPILRRQLRRTRAIQKETFERYRRAGYVFPRDLPANLCDRVHAHILWVCQRRYGGRFWEDFFKEIAKEQENLQAAKYLADPDKIRNRKYQITVECFDRLGGIEFKEILKENHISLTTAIKSLRPTEPGWDRKFIPKTAQHQTSRLLETSESAAVVVDPEVLPPLHRAAYGGHTGKVKQLIEDRTDMNSKGPNGWTPLHMAAIGGHRKTAEILLDAGADISARDELGRTAVKLAEMHGHSALTRFLRDRESQNK